jgi:hypothetical protein
VTGEEFMELYLGSTELRQYIVDTAKRRSRRKELQEEYVQEAWLAVSCAPGGYCIEAYAELVDKVIYSSYWKNRKEYILHDSARLHAEAKGRQTPERITDNDKGFMVDDYNQNRRY